MQRLAWRLAMTHDAARPAPEKLVIERKLHAGAADGEALFSGQANCREKGT
jgi:2-C-methyl-D-erythritol 4-phosphate cytidylyltransferase